MDRHIPLGSTPRCSSRPLPVYVPAFLDVCAERRQYKRIVCGIVAGLSFAGAFGLSTYVAIGFALVMTAWLAPLLFTTRDRRHLTAIAIASSSLRSCWPHTSRATHA